MTSLDDAHVIVTGGSEGIGLAVAEAARVRGARVSLIARRESTLADAADRIGGGTRWAVADVADRAAVNRAVQDLVSEQGPCDLMVANAGYTWPGRFWELPDEAFGAEMQTNYLGAVHAAAAVIPDMRRRRRGHLCFVSSTAGFIGVYGYGAYSPTKFAVRSLGEVLRSELKPDGVKVSVVFPPDTDTPGFAKENEDKPAETAAISGSIAPVPASKVAAAVMKGIEQDRFAIYADPTTALIARGGEVLAPMIRWMSDRKVAQAQRRR